MKMTFMSASSVKSRRTVTASTIGGKGLIADFVDFRELPQAAAPALWPAAQHEAGFDKLGFDLFERRLTETVIDLDRVPAEAGSRHPHHAEAPRAGVDQAGETCPLPAIPFS